MRRASPLAFTIFAATLLSTAASTMEARADGARVRVRGTSHLDARVARADSKLLLSGTLVDDAARPIGGARVALTIRSKGDDRAVTFGDGNVAGCGVRASAKAPAIEAPDRLAVRTDDVGRYCVEVALPPAPYVARLDFEGAGNIDGAHNEVTLDPARKPVALAFDPEPRAIDLDQEPAPFDVVATVEENGTTAPATGLVVELTSESGALLFRGNTNASGRARVALDVRSLGAPGPGEIRATFAGDADAASASRVVAIERHAHVMLGAAAAASGRLPAGSPEDGVTIAVTARARGPSAALAGGSVEARVGDTIVGAAPLEGGSANVVVTFATPPASSSAAEVPIVLRYAPDAPWFLRGDDLALTLPVHGPSPWRQAPLVIAGVLVIAWLVLGRSRAPMPKREKISQRPRAARAEAKVEVIRVAEGASGWNGFVVDAHDDYGVPNARVSIVRAGFERIEVIASAETNERGWFELPAIETAPGDALAAEGPLHAAYQEPLPPSGELSIALVQRKRALVDRLVAWARARGRPFDAAPEPTPGQVRRSADAELTVARWADAVERAAYSGTIVDARAEAEVDRLAPPPLSPHGGADPAATVLDPPRGAFEDEAADGAATGVDTDGSRLK